LPVPHQDELRGEEHYYSDFGAEEGGLMQFGAQV